MHPKQNNFPKLQFIMIGLISMISVLLILSCNSDSSGGASSGKESLAFNNAGLTLPDGFRAVLFADNLGRGRHMVVNENGDVYLRLRRENQGHTIAALRDSNGDGKADVTEYFGGPIQGTGIDIRNGYLYFSTDTSVHRQRLINGKLVPDSPVEKIVGGFLTQPQHAVKPFTFDDKNYMYVNIGAPSNACMEKLRTPKSPGLDPCPQLNLQAGIWRFSADELNQTLQEDGLRYASGIRNAVALDWNHHSNNLFALQHGRDQLNTLWPGMYTDEENAELPAEEFLLVTPGSNFGWPYGYFDHFQNKRVLAPEYGGDGKIVGRVTEFDDPIMVFPGHWAPNDLIFYQGDQFPAKYKNGAFIAFHGSWNRSPLGQQGFNVCFVPFEGDKPAGDFEIFADGFAGKEKIESSGDAEYRPCGLAEGPGGALFISDSKVGRIWKIIYTGS